MNRQLNRQTLPAPLRAALIDMDGTLYDSMPSHARAWMQMTAEYGLSADYDEFFMYEGRTGASTIDLLMRRARGRGATDEEKREMYHRKTECFAAQPPVSVMPGAQMMTRLLLRAGVTPVLVTGSGQSSLIARLDDDYPGVFAPGRRITSRDVTVGKPDPEPYLRALELAGCSAAEAIVIENAPLGVESGHRAGIYTVAVATGPIPAEALWEAGADAVFTSMQTFADVLSHDLTDIHS